MVLRPSRWNAGVQEPRGRAKRGRAASPGVCLWFPELQDWGPSSLGLSKAGLLQGQSETPTGRSAEIATRCLGPRFQGPVSPVRRWQGCGCLPTRGRPGVHWDASRRHHSAQFWWKRGRARTEHRSAERVSQPEQQGRQVALGDRSPGRDSAQALPPALQRQAAPSQRDATCGRAPPRTHGTERGSDGRSDSGSHGISLAGGRREGAERVDKGRSWGLRSRAGRGGWEYRRSPSLASPSPSPSPQHVRRRLGIHSESGRHVSQLRAVGHRAAAQAAETVSPSTWTRAPSPPATRWTSDQ